MYPLLVFSVLQVAVQLVTLNAPFVRNHGAWLAVPCRLLHAPLLAQWVWQPVCMHKVIRCTSLLVKNWQECCNI